MTQLDALFRIVTKNGTIVISEIIGIVAFAPLPAFGLSLRQCSLEPMP